MKIYKWLKPTNIVIFLAIPVILISLLVPSSVYYELYNSKKQVNVEFAIYAIIIFLSFVIGSLFVFRKSTAPSNLENFNPRKYIGLSFSLTLIGYFSWFVVGVIRAGGLINLWEMVFSLAVGNNAVAENIKFKIFETVPGLTTLTQFGIVYVTIESYNIAIHRKNLKRKIIRVGIIIFASLLRSVILSERLAFIELILPFFLVQAVFNKNWRNLKIIKAAPIFFPIFVILFFSIAEYFRSWQYYKSFYHGTFFDFSIFRIMGYYITSVNNAAIYFQYQAFAPAKNTFTDLINFPGIGDFFSQAYADLFPQTGHLELLRLYGTAEFNNLPFVGAMLIDFGYFFGAIVSFVFGVLSNTIYRSFVNGNEYAMILYPSYYIGLIEISRIYYWANQRYFPVIVFMFLIFIFRGKSSIFGNFSKKEILHYKR